MTVSLKLDSLQPTGSFKVRGAIAACSALPAGSRIVTASAGNHALGTAWASAKLGVPATVVVAETASSAKREALARLPVELIVYGQDYDTAEAFALTLATDPDRQATYVSPYNDPQVIAGQSTLLDELLAQMPGDRNRPLTIVAAVGGGGLVSGLSMRAHELWTEDRPIRIIGVEAAASLAVSAAVKAGDTYEVPIGDTIADGLSGNLEPGSITVGLIAEYTGPSRERERGAASCRDPLARKASRHHRRGRRCGGNRRDPGRHDRSGRGRRRRCHLGAKHRAAETGGDSDGAGRVILVFGIKTFRWGSDQTDYLRTCPQCGFYGYFVRKKAIRAVTLFFVIPVFPLSGITTVDVCPQCNTPFIRR